MVPDQADSGTPTNNINRSSCACPRVINKKRWAGTLLDDAFQRTTAKRPWSTVRDYVRYWPLADIEECAVHVRFWGQSRHGFLREVAFVVAIGGKADVTFCGANVRL